MGPLGEVMVDRGTGSIRDLHEQPAGRIYVHAVTQLEISSTELRQLHCRGPDPRYLVPEEVRKIIRETGCYAPAAVARTPPDELVRSQEKFTPAHDHPHTPRAAARRARLALARHRHAPRSKT